MIAAIFLAAALAVGAAPARAKTIAPAEAHKHVGQTVTVQGAVTEVRHLAAGRELYIALGGRYPRTVVRAAIIGDDTARFPDTDKLKGQTVAITGVISLYKGRVEIAVHDPNQIEVK